MAPSLLRLGAAALACASSAVAVQKYQVKEEYNPSNFFDADKFRFFSGKDLNNGYIKYRNQSAAIDGKLVEYTSDGLKIGVNAVDNEEDGRSSVRLESAKQYNGGLFVADFAHFPKAACGAWPAFWMVGPNWPTDGEIDIYEGWNLNPRNKVVLHTGDPNVVGTCKIQPGDFSSTMIYENCYNSAPGQPSNTGCVAEETNGLWGNPNGGVCECSSPCKPHRRPKLTSAG
jgi:beta-glucanase (GH16 family)